MIYDKIPLNIGQFYISTRRIIIPDWDDTISKSHRGTYPNGSYEMAGLIPIQMSGLCGKVN